MTHPASAAAPPTPAQQQLAATFDALYAARARTDLVARLYAAAMGENYPHEVSASSSCDWPLLGLMVARLRMRPGQLLIDAGCGTGGVGLWLARALAVRLVGIDISPVAVAKATARRTRFVTAGRASFRVGTLQATGLSTGHADGIVCVDALSFAADRGAALIELGRVLAPGARLVCTRALRHGAEPAWGDQARAAGLVVEHVDERPHEPTMWQRLYGLWRNHEAELRRELDKDQVENMLAEAHRKLPTLPGRRAVLLTLKRPAAPPAADRMTSPDNGPASLNERTPR